MEKPLYKLYAILSQEAVKAMNGNRGRMATQAAHGFLHAFWDGCDRFPEMTTAYRAQPSAFKVTLVAVDSEALRILEEKYRPICGVSLVVERGTKSDGSVNEAVKAVTCLGLGPILLDKIGEDLSGLKNFL
jgi:hypothetical protein